MKIEMRIDKILGLIDLSAILQINHNKIKWPIIWPAVFQRVEENIPLETWQIEFMEEWDREERRRMMRELDLIREIEINRATNFTIPIDVNITVDVGLTR